MTLDASHMYWILGGGIFLFLMLTASAFSDNVAEDLKRRLSRVGPGGTVRKIKTHDRAAHVLRRSGDSGIPLMNQLIRLLPNPDKLRSRLARTGKTISLGEYLMFNALGVMIFFLIFHLFGWARPIVVLLALGLGLGIPHFITGFMGARRIKKFLASFPEAIDTMCRGIRSGLPITESIAAVGREMPEPVGTEFHRIADGVHMGKSLESSMWEVTRRIDTPEFRFLIIAMAIQKETGGNLAETLGNLADLIRKRRQLRLKIKAMSSEARASAMIIGSLPFIMFTLLMIVNSDYMMTLFTSLKGKMLMGAGVFWMSLGWAAMIKMIHFEI
ncbi:MAG: type II secretion system F family protein [Alphaproteobacteria bacterium]|nr:type II secretion system F family protein [Alphaproteobacteria bacterium]